MISINNSHGYLGNRGKVIYKEKIREGLYVVVILLYDQYLSKNYGDSTHICIMSAVTDGSTHKWSNGVISFEEAKGYGVEMVREEEEFRSLESLRTKNGFLVYEHPTLESHFDENGLKMKKRFIHWIVSIPEDDLIKITMEYHIKKK